MKCKDPEQRVLVLICMVGDADFKDNRFEIFYLFVFWVGCVFLTLNLFCHIAEIKKSIKLEKSRTI